MKKAFDISFRPQIESGEYKVVTRDDLPVRILCYDRKGRFSIIALVDNGEIETKEEYKPDGHLLSDSSDHRLDLFVITPEPELTEFEKHVQALMMNSGLVGCTECYKDIDTVKTTAKSLLEYAKKELNSGKLDDDLIRKMMHDWRDKMFDGYSDKEAAAYKLGLTDMYLCVADKVEEAYRSADGVQYEKGRKEGLKQAKDDIPQWHRIEPYDGQLPLKEWVIMDGMLRNSRLGYEISIDELFKKLQIKTI